MRILVRIDCVDFAQDSVLGKCLRQDMYFNFDYLPRVKELIVIPHSFFPTVCQEDLWKICKSRGVYLRVQAVYHHVNAEGDVYPGLIEVELNDIDNG